WNGFAAKQPSLIFAGIMQISCSPGERILLDKIAAAASKLNVECYLVGGFVRDKLLNRTTKDADVVCLGDGIELAKAVANLFDPKPGVQFFKNFGTAQIRVWVEREEGHKELFDLEFVGARKESYQQHSRKPFVAPGSFLEDQERRDFTINALAISLNKHNYGELI